MKLQRLQDLRIDHDLTQAEVAEKLGCQRNVYSRYELGYRMIPLDMLMELADLYDVSLDYITERTNEKKTAGR